MNTSRRTFLQISAAAAGLAAMDPQALLKPSLQGGIPPYLYDSEAMSNVFGAQIRNAIADGAYTEVRAYQIKRSWLELLLNDNEPDIHMHELAKRILKKSGFVPPDTEFTKQNVRRLLQQIPSADSDYPILDIPPNTMHQEIW